MDNRKACYIEHSLCAIVRHGEGRFQQFEFMAADEIEVYFQIVFPLSTNITSLSAWGIHFAFWESVEHQDIKKVFNNVYPFDMDSPTYYGKQTGPQGLGLEPFSRSYDVTLGELTQGYTCKANQVITITLRDIPGLAFRKQAEQRVVSIRIAIEDTFGHHSEIIVKQKIAYTEKGYHREQSQFLIGALTHAQITLSNLRRNQTCTIQECSNCSVNSLYQTSLACTASLFYYQIDGNITKKTMYGPYIQYLMNDWSTAFFSTLSFYLIQLKTSSFRIEKEQLHLQAEDLKKAQTLCAGYPGGISFSIFTTLSYVFIPTTSIVVVGAFLEQQLTYAFIAELRQQAYPEDPILFQQYVHSYTTGSLFLHTQYEELPYHWIKHITD